VKEGVTTKKYYERTSKLKLGEADGEGEASATDDELSSK
jgi:hypothetical protein